MAVKQTAGRDALGEFAPKFAQFNDDVLFGEVWSREDKLSLRDRSLVTVVALMAQGLVDSSFQYHLSTAKQNGITRQEIAEILTHAAFYAGWPKAWAAFRMAKEVWSEEAGEDGKAQHQQEMVFPIGAPNDGFAQYFVGLLLHRPDSDIRYIERMNKLAEEKAKYETVVVKKEGAAGGTASVEEKADPVTTAVLKGNKGTIIDEVKKAIADGAKPEEIINDQLIAAINKVGEFFEQKKYFLPQLIASAN